MAPKFDFSRRIRPSYDNDDEDDDWESPDEEDVFDQQSIPKPLSGGEPDSEALRSSLSFGELAALQASLPRKRKRGQPSPTPSEHFSSSRRSPSPIHEVEEREAQKSTRFKKPARRSKDAPEEMSSKIPVSWKRNVVTPLKKPVPRDPRFGKELTAAEMNHYKQTFAFLNEYRAEERAELKKRIRETRNQEVKEQLKSELRSMEDQERTRQKEEEKQAIKREHRKREKMLLQKGIKKTPFYLKDKDVKKQALIKQYENLGPKKLERVIEKRRNKKAQRERRDMPKARRDVG